MQHCNVCTYEWKCTARVKCLLGKIKPEEVQVEMPKSIPVKTSRGFIMSQNKSSTCLNWNRLRHFNLKKEEGRKRMPNIGGKKFPYTKEGIKKAGMYKAKIKKKTKAKSKKKSV